MKFKYKKAPLPFVGQKSGFISQYAELIDTNIPGDGSGWTLVDVFGGSGLLSRVAKDLKPKARVIYNDFINYAERLAHISDTNRLRTLIYNYVSKKYSYGAKLELKDKTQVLNIIDSFSGYVDTRAAYSWLAFSGSEFDSWREHPFYHHIPKVDYQLANDYLVGLEVTHEDFKNLIPKFSLDTRAVLILDPPYLYTDCCYYNDTKYFDLVEFLNLMLLIKPPFLFFSSSKSEFESYASFAISKRLPNHTALQNMQRISRMNILNKHYKYQDNLYFCFAS